MTHRELPIPSRLNLTLLLVVSLACAGLLYGASHATSTLTIIACAFGFSYTANTMFSLLHESVHGVFHTSAAINTWAGRWAAALFPTGLSLQRGFHLTHHQNNRSPIERFDYLEPGELKWLKRAQWYAILTGLYWGVSVLGVLLYLVAPWLLRRRTLRDRDSVIAAQTSSVAYLSVLDELNPWTARLEILFSLLVQAVMFIALDLSLLGWLACYAAFGLHWSSLQYADHAFSPLDRRDGAWNLRVNPVTRALFLNYHYHLAHHQHPRTPWIHLGRMVDTQLAQPSFLRIWLRMWRGPQPRPREPER